MTGNTLEGESTRLAMLAEPTQRRLDSIWEASLVPTGLSSSRILGLRDGEEGLAGGERHGCNPIVVPAGKWDLALPTSRSELPARLREEKEGGGGDGGRTRGFPRSRLRDGLEQDQ